VVVWTEARGLSAHTVDRGFGFRFCQGCFSVSLLCKLEALQPADHLLKETYRMSHKDQETIRLTLRSRRSDYKLYIYVNTRRGT
jgi:hypothetical protein